MSRPPLPPPTRFPQAAPLQRRAGPATVAPPPPPGMCGRLQGGVVQGCFPGGQCLRLPSGTVVQAKGMAPGVRAAPLPGHLLRGGDMGRALPDEVRGRLEDVFRADLSAVRLHVGPAAAAMGALAFAHGSDIHFATGQLDLATPRGLHLLGHEVAHVLQQRSGRAANPLGQGVALLLDPALEAEADRMGQRAAVQASRMAFARPAAWIPAPPPGRRAIQRMEDVVKAPSGHAMPQAWALETKSAIEVQNQLNIQRVESQNATFVGFHGSSITHTLSILQRINPPLGGVSNGENLGPGFYVAKQLGFAVDMGGNATFGEVEYDEDRFMDKKYMSEYEEKTRRQKAFIEENFGKYTSIYRIYAIGFDQMESLVGPQAEIRKVVEEVPKEELWLAYDYLATTDAFQEVKFHPKAFPKLIATLN